MKDKFLYLLIFMISFNNINFKDMDIFSYIIAILLLINIILYGTMFIKNKNKNER